VHQQARFDPYLGIFSGPLISPGLTYSASREAGSLSGTISIGDGVFRIKAFDGWRSRLRRITPLWRWATGFLLHDSGPEFRVISLSAIVIGIPVQFDPSTGKDIIFTAHCCNSPERFFDSASSGDPTVTWIGAVKGAVIGGTHTKLLTPAIEIIAGKFIRIFPNNID
jgi:hypothetical protein